MKKQTIIWSALPNGISGEKARLSIHVSAQLYSDAVNPTLSLFSDWLHWAHRMQSASFKLGFRNPAAATPDVIVDATVVSSASPDHWDAIFGASTPIKPFQFPDYPERTFRSYPVKNVLHHVKNVYSTVAVDHPDVKPTADKLGNKFKDFCFYDIPVRQKPKTGFDGATINSTSFSQQKQPETRTYKRQPFGEAERKRYYASLDQLLSTFLPRDIILKKNQQSAATQITKFREYIKQDYLYLVQDPTSKLCSSANDALSAIYRQLAEFQAVPPSNPDSSRDLLETSLFFKPRNKFNENYMATSWLRSQKKNGKPFYYIGAQKKDGSPEAQEKFSTDRTMSQGSVQPYTSDLMHEGEVNPYAFAKSKTPKFDFHDIVTSLQRYPWLLRKLGLTIDVEIPASALPAATLAQPFHVYVVPTFVQDAEAGVPKTNFSPRTAYVMSGAIFSAAPRNAAKPEALHGLLALGTKEYFEVVTVEPGGSALKMLNTVNNLARHAARFTPLYIPKNWDLTELHPESADNDSDASLPALQNNGIGVSRNGRAFSLVTLLQASKATITKINSKQTFVAANNMAAASAVDVSSVMYLEDIVRGWRADYKDLSSGTPWRSLMKRDGTYEFLNNPSLNQLVSDEGYTGSALSQSSDSSSDQLYAGEMLFEWTGWSLVASRPAMTLSKDEMKPDGTPDILPPNSSPVSSDGTQIKVTFLPTSKTLPRLRYGHVYQVRARTVDLAGNSWDLDTVPDTSIAPKTVSEKVKYYRHEVVKTPVVLLRDALTEKDGSGQTVPLSHAESVEHLVVRSNRAKSVPQYVSEHAIFKEDTVRYLTAPKVDYTFAETHGVFDSKYFDVNDWSALYSLITKRDYQFTNAVTEGGYTCFKEDVGTKDTILIGTFKMPYLPDPLAKGIVLRGVPGTRAVMNGNAVVQHAKIYVCSSNGSTSMVDDVDDLFTKGVVLIEFENAATETSWIQNYPHDGYITIKLVEGAEGSSAAPSWDVASKTLTIYIEKSDVWRVMYSSLLQKDDAAQYFALQSWIDEAPNSTAKDRARKYVDRSSHWMLTPYRNLMLTHAVQQPLKDPEWYKQSLLRSIGESVTMLKDAAFVVHGKSTVKVDFTASWELQVDDQTFDTPQDIVAELYDVNNTEMLGRQAQAGNLHVGDVSIDKRLSTSVQLALQHDFHDTKHRFVKYEPVATTRFREYFPQTGFDFSVTGKAWSTHVVSTKRPEGLKLEYIVPVFAWATNEKSDRIVRTRMAGLRVYMDRPWFSSGSDEKLGVVLTTAGSSPENILSSPVAKLVTMWGYDPIWLSKPTPSELFPLPGFFLTKSKDLSDSEMKQGIVKGVTLDELSGNATTQQQYKSDIAVHDVFYDRERKLWYSDIMIAHGESYFPFIRLALCRVQPYSLRAGNRDVFISRITQADYMQVMPLRKTTVSFDPENSKTVRVTVEGVSYRSSAVGVVESEVELTLEEQTPSLGKDFGWTEVSTVPIDRVNAGILSGYWGGVLTLPKEKTAVKYRIVVREYEQFLADVIFDTDAQKLNLNQTSNVVRSKIERRIVFADVIEI